MGQNLCSLAVHRRLGVFFRHDRRLYGDISNLVYRKTARNFNPMIATAGRITIAEVEEIVPVGSLDPDQIHTPGIFVQRLIQGTNYEKHIERRTTQPRPNAGETK